MKTAYVLLRHLTEQLPPGEGLSHGLHLATEPGQALMVLLNQTSDPHQVWLGYSASCVNLDIEDLEKEPSLLATEVIECWRGRQAYFLRSELPTLDVPITNE